MATLAVFFAVVTMGNKNDAISLFSLLAVKFQVISLVSVVSMAASEMQ